MKHFIKYLAGALLITAGAFILFEITGIYKISLLDDNVQWSIYAKGVENAVDFDQDEQITYVAYKNYVKAFQNDGSEKIIFRNPEYNIEKILYYKNKMYILSDDKIYEYDIKHNISKIICSNIPYEGNYLKRQLIIKDNKILLSIGSATNSGIADKDNGENTTEIPYERSPINITLNGNNYGENKTGAYMAYGNSSIQGQKIKAQTFGNSSVVEINPESYEISLYCCGIRSISGWDLDSKNNLVGIVEGAQNIGSRPINRDSDYIYKIEKGKWYGWPDYSGGDSIDSPKFKNYSSVTKIISNPPSTKVPAPLYVFSKVQSMQYMVIDRCGQILEKDSIIYYDKNKNIICSLNESGAKGELLKLKEESNIKSIILKKEYVYILDSGIGCIYRMKADKGKISFCMPKEMEVVLIVIMVSMVFIFIYKLRNKNV